LQKINLKGGNDLRQLLQLLDEALEENLRTEVGHGKSMACHGKHGWNVKKWY
jgi:hypothetical protein